MNPADPTPSQSITLRVLTLGAIAAAALYFTWWFERPFGWVTDVIFFGVLAFHTAQVFTPWWLLLKAARRPTTEPPPVSVDVFVTAYREPAALVQRTLRAAVDMRYPHRTVLLDDAGRPELKAVAIAVGADYFARPDRTDAKAGNLNYAFDRSTGEIVVIFDADHAPEPEFLERSLGHFRDPSVGFVQVALSYRNGDVSHVARGARELSDDFFNALSLGMDGVGSCTLFGSNALIRRTALETIGGYRPGLAEDLATSLELHAAGWKSAYVAEPLAPGLLPPTLTAYFTQQLKWARGVFEELLFRYPRVFPKLTWPQRLSYLTRSTFYAYGLYTFVHLLIAWSFLFGLTVAPAIFADYVLRYVPLMAMILIVEAYALRIWSGRYRVKVRGASLALGTWPVYIWGALLTVLRRPVPYLETRKQSARTNAIPLVLPQAIAVGLTLAGVGMLLIGGLQWTGPEVAVLAFASFLVAMHASVFLGAWEGFRGDPRPEVDVQEVATEPKESGSTRPLNRAG